jgi:hypothetical protein
VKHFASPKFWTAYEALPLPVRKLADANFALLKAIRAIRLYNSRKSAGIGPLASACAIAPSPSKWTAAISGSGSAHMPTTTD